MLRASSGSFLLPKRSKTITKISTEEREKYYNEPITEEKIGEPEPKINRIKKIDNNKLYNIDTEPNEERYTEEYTEEDHKKFLATLPLGKKKDREETEEETEHSPSKSRGGGGEDFEHFWSAYPRKVGKLAAQKAWARLNGNRPDIEQVLSKLEQLKQGEAWTREGGRYIPHPTTWINAGVGIVTGKQLLLS